MGHFDPKGQGTLPRLLTESPIEWGDVGERGVLAPDQDPRLQKAPGGVQIHSSITSGSQPHRSPTAAGAWVKG